MENGLKTCSKCGLCRPRADFNRSSESRDGLGYQCRACDNAASREYGRLHRAAIRERQHRNYQPEAQRRKEARRARQASWRLNETLKAASPDKTCSACGLNRPRAEFNRSARSFDGLVWQCRACQRIAKQAWHLAHKAAENAKSRAYGKSHAEYTLARHRRYLKEHPRTEWRKRYQAKNADRMRQKRATAAYRERRRREERARRTAHLAETRERCRRQQAVRWHAAKANPVSYDAVYARDAGICYLCTEPVTQRAAHFDHVIPLSRGGTHTFDNIKVTHPSCNVRKGAKLVQPGAYAKI
jgi:5-methylcytosine-specific restriction endonuclease McrA